MEIRSDVDVELIQQMGDDRSVVAAARVSTKGWQSQEDFCAEDVAEGLINFLMKNRHGTPFEHNSFTIFTRAPIFVYREFHRHRIGFSYNEESGRYKELEPIFYVPGAGREIIQRPGGKPGHYEYETGTLHQYEMMEIWLSDAYEHAYRAYTHLLAMGVAKEVARMCLPVSIYSSQYVTCNARSIMAFLSLRQKFSEEEAAFPSKPMKEINMVADKIEAIFAECMPITHAAFVRNRRVAP